MIGAILSLLLFLLLILLYLIYSAIIFPLPISDTGNVRYSTIPIITLLLIAVNGLIFLILQATNYYQGLINYLSGQESLGLRMLYDYSTQIWTYGYRDVFVHNGVSIGAFAAVSSMFMHADMWHLIGNMIILWAFGRRVEDACGPWRYLAFYLVAGLIANIGSDLLNPVQTDIPGIGASGAIAGVMGAYLILFPTSLVNCIWVIGVILRAPIVLILKVVGVQSVQNAPFWRWTIRLPAWMFLIVWVVMNTIPSIETIQGGRDFGGVNTLAHLTGFLGALLIFFFTKKDLVTRYFGGRTI